MKFRNTVILTALFLGAICPAISQSFTVEGLQDASTIVEGDKVLMVDVSASGNNYRDATLEQVVSPFAADPSSNASFDAAEWISDLGIGAGSGDMVAATYDPLSVAGNVFDADNHAIDGSFTNFTPLTPDVQAALDAIDLAWPAGGGGTWGSITGTLSSQTDLQAALDGKATSAQGALADTAVQPNTAPVLDATNFTNLPAGGGGTWGSITGTLSTQTDLQAALDGKATSAQGTLADTALQPGDIVDNVTSTSTTVPLSANQGRILQAAIDAIPGGGGGGGSGSASYINLYDNPGFTNTSAVGSASANDTFISTGTTPNSSITRFYNQGTMPIGSLYNYGINFSSKFEFGFQFKSNYNHTPTTDCVFYFLVGDTTWNAAVAGDPTNKTVGVRITGDGLGDFDVDLVVHDGSALTVESTNVKVTADSGLNRWSYVVIKNDGVGNVTLTLTSGNLLTETTISTPNGPVGISNGGLKYAAFNGAAGTNSILDTKFYAFGIGETTAGGGGTTDADLIVVDGTPTNYTAASGFVQEHLEGIDAALAIGGGTAAGTSVSATPVTYTASAQNVEQHLTGIDGQLDKMLGPIDEVYYLEPQYGSLRLKAKMMAMGVQNGFLTPDWGSFDQPMVEDQKLVVCTVGDSITMDSRTGGGRIAMWLLQLFGKLPINWDNLSHETGESTTKDQGLMYPMDWLYQISSTTLRQKFDYTITPTGTFHEIAPGGHVLFYGRDGNERLRTITNLKVALIQQATAGIAQVQYSEDERFEHETWTEYEARATWTTFTDGAAVDLAGATDQHEFDIDVTQDTTKPIIFKVNNTDATDVIKLVGFLPRNENTFEVVAYNGGVGSASIVDLGSMNAGIFAKWIDFFEFDLLFVDFYADTNPADHVTGLASWNTAITTATHDPVVVINTVLPQDWSVLDATLYPIAKTNGWGWFSLGAYMGRDKTGWQSVYLDLRRNTDQAQVPVDDDNVHPGTILAELHAAAMIEAFKWNDPFKVPYRVTENICSSAGFFDDIEERVRRRFTSATGKTQAIEFEETQYYRNVSEAAWSGVGITDKSGKMTCINNPVAGVTTNTDLTVLFVVDLDFKQLAEVGGTQDMLLFSLTGSGVSIPTAGAELGIALHFNPGTKELTAVSSGLVQTANADVAVAMESGRGARHVFGNGISIGIFRYNYASGDLSCIVNGVELFQGRTFGANRNWQNATTRLTLGGALENSTVGALGKWYYASVFTDWLTRTEAYEHINNPAQASHPDTTNCVFATRFDNGCGYLVKDISGLGNHLQIGGIDNGSPAVSWLKASDVAKYEFADLALANPGDSTGLVRLGQTFTEVGFEYGELVGSQLRPSGAVQITNNTGSAVNHLRLVAMDDDVIASANVDGLTQGISLENGESRIVPITGIPPLNYDYLGLSGDATTSAGLDVSFEVSKSLTTPASVINTSQLLEFEGFPVIIDNADFINVGTAGSFTANSDTLNTGSTAGSTATRYLNNIFLPIGGANAQRVDFNNPLSFPFRFKPEPSTIPTSDCEVWFVYGGGVWNGAITADPTTGTIGVKLTGNGVNGYDISLITHDGTTFREEATGDVVISTSTVNHWALFNVFNHGNGEVELHYKVGNSRALKKVKTNTGPTGNITNGNLKMAVSNGASTVNTGGLYKFSKVTTY